MVPFRGLWARPAERRFCAGTPAAAWPYEKLLDMVLVLKGSWDLVTGVISYSKVTILIVTYNPNSGTYNLTYQVP